MTDALKVKIDSSQIKRFARTLRQAMRGIADFTDVFEELSDWLHGKVDAQFDSEGKEFGPGWPDLTPGYKQRKRRAVGFVYPMMVRHGDLEGSFKALEMQSRVFRWGSEIEYGRYHQEGGGHLRKRQLIPDGNDILDEFVRLVEKHYETEFDALELM